jgi:hypothetical protein
VSFCISLMSRCWPVPLPPTSDPSWEGGASMLLGRYFFSWAVRTDEVHRLGASIQHEHPVEEALK